MFTAFTLQKSVQAAAVILRAEGKKMSRLRLLKLLYLVERKCLQTAGYPFLGGPFYIMQHGPLHGAVYDLIKGTHPGEAKWSRFIMREGPRDIRLVSEPTMSELSPFEVKVLNEIVDLHAPMDDYEVAEITHMLPEVRGRRPLDNGRIPLPLEEIVASACPPEYRDEIIDDLKEKAAGHAISG